jgi:hypothetical protein
VSWAPVGQPGDLFTDPHLRATSGLVDVFNSRFGGGDGKLVGLPALPAEFGGLAEAGVIAARTGRFFRGEPLENVVTTT